MKRIALALIVTVALVLVGVALNMTPEADAPVLAARGPDTTSPTRTSTLEQGTERNDPSTTVETVRPSTLAPDTSAFADRPVDTPPPATTATTSAGTTSTAPPTTSAPKIVLAGSIPKTIPYPGGLDKYGGHEAILSCGASTPEFDCNQFGSNHWWDAPYLGTNLPYTPGYAWVDGDRQGYSCAYGFLQDLSTGELIGRWAGILPPDAEAYGKVNDRFMDEGVRYYDGELANEPGMELSDPSKASECKDILSTNIDYSAVNNGPDERPRVGFFNSAGQVVDIRDYSNTALSSPGKFKLLSFDGRQAIVAFYPAQNNLAAVTFYYTAMGSGQLAVDFNGSGPYQP